MFSRVLNDILWGYHEMPLKYQNINYQELLTEILLQFYSDRWGSKHDITNYSHLDKNFHAGVL